MLSCIGTRLWLLLEQTFTVVGQAAKMPAKRWPWSVWAGSSGQRSTCGLWVGLRRRGGHTFLRPPNLQLLGLSLVLSPLPAELPLRHIPVRPHRPPFLSSVLVGLSHLQVFWSHRQKPRTSLLVHSSLPASVTDAGNRPEKAVGWRAPGLVLFPCTFLALPG